MEFLEFDITGPILIKPDRYEDSRGHFTETFVASAFASNICDANFVQDNESFSTSSDTIRGLHCQSPPFAQGKLVRCITGSIIDVAVDIRVGSPTFMKYVRARLTAENGHQLWIPTGFLHGFATQKPNTVVAYKTTAEYSPNHDETVAFDDPDLAVDWELEKRQPILSPKDQEAPSFVTFESPFEY